jgi:hypothetical protein
MFLLAVHLRDFDGLDTSSTRLSGAEAPAVRPTTFRPRTQAGSNSLPSAIR